MKTTLKTFPIPQEGQDAGRSISDMWNWKEGFEAELREILKQNYNYKDYWKTIIKEILGENK